jgi:prepilin-type N-terminal cleavage/methylation domain-containing protein
MRSERILREKGFTLVELIVVIAIVAILASVVFPGFAQFIDRGRFSNDTQKAASMTKVIQSHLIASNESNLNSHDIRTIIESYHDGEFDFTPEASNTGFFYFANSKKIIASKYDDVENINDGGELFLKTVLLNHISLNATKNSPEELFGAGKHLLTTEGSPVAMAVHFVNTMADQGSGLKEAYEKVEQSLETYQDNIFIRFFKLGLSDNLRTKLEELLVAFDPDTTLFVNNVNWVTSAENGNDINNIVFKPGISNIPPMRIDITGSIPKMSISIPKTVRTIQSEAFTDKFAELSIIIQPNMILKVEENAINGSNISIDSSKIIEGTLELVDYSEYINIQLLEGGSFSYDLTELPIKEQVTGYIFNVNQGVLTVKIYTNEGLVGYATNAYTIRFFLNQGDAFRYFTLTNVTQKINFPQNPSRSEYTFGGWYYIDNGVKSFLTNGQLLQGLPRQLDVYAEWNE